MKFIVDSNSKTVTLLEKISMKEIEQLKIWLGADWESWAIDTQERIIEKDKWMPINPFPQIPLTPFPDPYPNPIQPYPNPYQPYYTTCLDNEAQLMVECNSVKDLASYDAVMHEASNFSIEKNQTV